MMTRLAARTGPVALSFSTLAWQSLRIRVGCFGTLIFPSRWKGWFFSEKYYNLSDNAKKKLVRRTFPSARVNLGYPAAIPPTILAPNAYRKVRRILCSSELPAHPTSYGHSCKGKPGGHFEVVQHPLTTVLGLPAACCPRALLRPALRTRRSVPVCSQTPERANPWCGVRSPDEA